VAQCRGGGMPRTSFRLAMDGSLLANIDTSLPMSQPRSTLAGPSTGLLAVGPGGMLVQHRGEHSDYFLCPASAPPPQGAAVAPLVVMIGWLNTQREWRARRAVDKAAEAVGMYTARGCDVIFLQLRVPRRPAPPRPSLGRSPSNMISGGLATRQPGRACAVSSERRPLAAGAAARRAGDDPLRRARAARAHALPAPGAGGQPPRGEGRPCCVACKLAGLTKCRAVRREQMNKVDSPLPGRRVGVGVEAGGRSFSTSSPARPPRPPRPRRGPGHPAGGSRRLSAAHRLHDSTKDGRPWTPVSSR
jgi:hypothetical protein